MSTPYKYIDINQFLKYSVPITDETIQKYQSQCPELKGVPIHDYSVGIIFKDPNDNVVGFVNITGNYMASNHIQSYGKGAKYADYPIERQLIQYAIDHFHVNPATESFAKKKSIPLATQEELAEKLRLFNEKLYPRLYPIYTEFRDDLLKAGRKKATEWAFYKKVDYTVAWNTEIYENENHHIVLDVEMSTYNYYAITRGKDPFLCRERSADIQRFLKSIAYMYESRFQMVWRYCSLVFDQKGDNYTYYLRFILDDLK